MKTTTKQLSKTKVELTVTLDADELSLAYKKASDRLAKDVKVDGFRKGKVPAEVAAKHIDPNQLNSVALDIAVRNAVPAAFEKSSKTPLMMPEIEVTKFVPNQSVEFKATADILPDIKLADFKKLKVKPTETKVSAKDIDEVIDKIWKDASKANKNIRKRNKKKLR